MSQLSRDMDDVRRIRELEEAVLRERADNARLESGAAAAFAAIELLTQASEALKADNARLRALVKAGERAMGNYATDGFCPWCGATRSSMEDPKWSEPHAADCPAFTADGVVR